jgi:hypothetical protein
VADRSTPGLVGIFPGTFNPPTVAHLAIAEAAVARGGLARLDLALSRAPLGKEQLAHPTVAERADVLRAVAASHPWLAVVVTDAQLIVDVARGYDLLVLGADKWAQVIDPRWYGGSVAARDDALTQLPPRVLVAPRGGDEPDGVELLEVDRDHAHVSSTRVRAGEHDLMLPEAVASGLWT